MATKILDLDVSQPLPDFTRTEDCGRLLVILWKEFTPLGMVFLETQSDTLSGAQIHRQITAALGKDPYTQNYDPPPRLADNPENPLITVVVPTCGRPEFLGRCLAALRGQTYNNFEVLVVDNAAEGSKVPGLMSSFFSEMRYTVEPCRGVIFARNRGIREARGSIIAFTDDDCQPVAGWLEAIAADFSERPNLGCVTGPILPLELKTRAQELLEHRGGFTRGFQRMAFTPGDRGQGPAYPVQAWRFGSGGSMAFRKSVFQELGPFDRTLRTAEDLDMFYRVLRGGYDLIYEPAAVVRHQHVRSMRRLRSRLYLWGLGYVSFLAKVARTDPLNRIRALREIRSWLYPYQVRDRLWPALTGRDPAGYPPGLVLAEIMGGLAGLQEYFRPHPKPRRRSNLFPPAPEGQYRFISAIPCL